MNYDPQDALSDPARPSCSLKRLAGGMALMLVALALFGIATAWLQATFLPPNSLAAWSEALAHGTTPQSVLVNLYLFAFVTASLGIALKVVHKRGLRGLVGPVPLALSQFLRVLKYLVGLYLVTLLLPVPASLQLSPNLNFGLWITLLPPVLIGLLIQTSAEELVFRGYLQSQLAARFRHPILWIGLPSVLFALMHFDPNIDGTSAWLVVIWALLFAVFTADLTARSGTLGPAIALHIVNNVSAIAIAAPVGRFDGLALYSYPFSPSDSQLMLTWMPVELLIMLCSWLVARIALRV